jgi:hypothetical protein
LLLAPGNVHNAMMAPDLLSAAGPIKRLIADKTYDTNPLRSLLYDAGTKVVIPSIARRKPLIPYDRKAQRNLIERILQAHRNSLRQARPQLPLRYRARSRCRGQ